MNAKKQAGFSLLEMSLVLVIIGILFSAFITPLQTYMHYKKVVEMCEEQEKVRQALLNFSIVHGRLPWAADKNGKEKSGKTQGFLPWYTLSMHGGNKSVFDYRYQVLSQWADPNPDPPVRGKCDIQQSFNQLSVNFCSLGELKVYRPGGQILYDKAVALAYSPFPLQKKHYALCEPGITWLSAEIVLGHLVMAGRLY